MAARLDRRHSFFRLVIASAALLCLLPGVTSAYTLIMHIPDGCDDVDIKCKD
jgi:hypothetical protein